MIRKDFTLQNYVGTGGNCDARAVRCHERIARWHTMCEHQLSHISDFVIMQSQQNIQELGQTMKTLNQFYDDALKRSRVEVPDENGNETRTDLSGFSHGCVNLVVQGSSPSDYDGTELNNTAGSASRLVGKEGVQQYHHGTAEPEMRGLYILLTIDNDGGMEVMRYAAHLSRERPEIFQSVPVQLALNIYKVRSNYSEVYASPHHGLSSPYCFLAGQERIKLFQIFSLLALFLHTVPVRLHHVQICPADAQTCIRNHVQNVWREESRNK